MIDSDRQKVAVGLLLLGLSTVFIFGPGSLGLAAPIAVIALGTLGIAAGALLVGTAGHSRPV